MSESGLEQVHRAAGRSRRPRSRGTRRGTSASPEKPGQDHRRHRGAGVLAARRTRGSRPSAACRSASGCRPPSSSKLDPVAVPRRSARGALARVVLAPARAGRGSRPAAPRAGITLIFSPALTIVGRHADAEHRLEQHGHARVAGLDRLRGRLEVGGVEAQRAIRASGSGVDSKGGRRSPWRLSTGAILAARCRRCAASRRGRRALGGEREAEHALLGDADRVDAAAVELEHLAGALVDDEVAAHLVGVLRAQPLAPYWAPASSSAVNTSISSPASGRQPSSASASGRRPRRPPGSSCRARRDPRRSRRAARPTRPPLPPDPPVPPPPSARVDVAEQAQGRPVGPRASGRSGSARPGTAASSSHSKPARLEQPASHSWAGPSLPAG